MRGRYKYLFRTVSLFTVFCILHIYVLAGSAAPTANITEAAPALPQASGTIKTTNNQPVIVNGNSVRPGTTVLSGSMIQTPAGVAATLSLGFATVEMTPNSEMMVEFAAGQNVKVTLKRGCALVRVTGNAQGTIISPDGSTTSTGDNNKQIQICSPSQGGIGAAAGTGGINKTLLTVLIVGGAIGVVAIILAVRGGNPSPSTP